MLISESTGCSLNVKTEEYAYHLEIEKLPEKDCFKVRYGRGVSNSSYFLSNAGWQRFLNKCKEIGVFAWEEIYDFPTYGGDGWFLKFDFENGKAVSFVGRYNYPENWGVFVTYLENFTNQGKWYGSDTGSGNERTQQILPKQPEKQTGAPFGKTETEGKAASIDYDQPPVQRTEFVPSFIEQRPGDYKVKLEDLFSEDELAGEGLNAFDKQVAKFSTFVKTGSHTFVNMIMNGNDENKKE